ncbi:MAG: hypothetical protein IKY98_05480 [Alphaproteobacteria bacterium]|nr:hypothetical protein [Alphaproteobacteria bacterium]
MSFLNIPENINQQNAEGDTLLHQIVSQNTLLTRSDTINILKRHPDPFIMNNNGMTPRLLAELLGRTSHAVALAAYESSYKENLDRKRFQLIGDMLEVLPTLATSKYVINEENKQKFAKLRQQFQQINQRN